MFGTDKYFINAVFFFHFDVKLFKFVSCLFYLYRIQRIATYFVFLLIYLTYINEMRGVGGLLDNLLKIILTDKDAYFLCYFFFQRPCF